MQAILIYINHYISLFHFILFNNVSLNIVDFLSNEGTEDTEQNHTDSFQHKGTSLCRSLDHICAQAVTATSTARGCAIEIHRRQ